MRYIVILSGRHIQRAVPSLYVRVYHKAENCKRARRSSLTIREGISPYLWYGLLLGGFHHYTWGYIAEPQTGWPWQKVPSLYVRVYRTDSSKSKMRYSSLTIREGISSVPGCPVDSISFPHYTWGYIGKTNQQNDDFFVPSLCVSVCKTANI